MLIIADEAGFEALVGSEETIVPARIYKEKALCMSKGFISHALSNEVDVVGSIIKWLYLDRGGPRLLKEVVSASNELLSRRQNGSTSSVAGAQPLSTGAEMLLKRYLPFLEQRNAEADGG